MQWFYAYDGFMLMMTVCISEHKCVFVVLEHFPSDTQFVDVRFSKSQEEYRGEKECKCTDRKANVDVICYKQIKIGAKTWQLFRSGKLQIRVPECQ